MPPDLLDRRELLMSTPVRRFVALLAACALTGLVGCSDPAPPGGTTPSPADTPGGTTSASPSGSSSTAPTSTAPAPTTTAAVKNDLASGKTQRTLSAAPLTANVEYSTSLATKNWQPEVTKPLRVSVTAFNNRKKGQRIYLSRVTASVSAYDDSGLVDGPRAITDTANISPGYYVTFPTEYGQTLLLPAVDDGAIRLTVDFTYEFVAQVSGDKGTGAQRDFAKQTATDRIAVPLA